SALAKASAHKSVSKPRTSLLTGARQGVDGKSRVTIPFACACRSQGETISSETIQEGSWLLGVFEWALHGGIARTCPSLIGVGTFSTQKSARGPFTLKMSCHSRWA